MASPSRRLPSQKAVLQRQIVRIGEQIDTGDPWHEALMLEWYARYQPESFAKIAERCARLEANSYRRADLNQRSWQYHLPLYIASSAPREKIAALPPYTAFALNDVDYHRRMRARLAVYFAAPGLRAEALYDACIMAVRVNLNPRGMLFLAGACAGGLDVVWRVREQTQERHDWLDEVVSEVARGAVVWNPYAQEVTQLMLHMVIENTGMREEVAYWRDELHIERDERSLREDLRRRAAPLTGAHANLAEIEAMSRWQQKDEQVRCPLFIGSDWYRLMRAEDGRCRVERREKDDRWSRESAVTVAEFIEELRRVKGV